MRKIVDHCVGSILFVVVLVLVAVPVVLVVWISFFRTEFIVFPPKGYSFKWFSNLGMQTEFLSSALLSIKVAAIAMVFSVVIGTVTAVGISRLTGRWASILRSFVLSPMMIPGIVLGTAVFVTYTKLGIIMGLKFVPTDAMLIAGHVLITVPWTIRLVWSALIQFNEDIIDASLNLGATRNQTFFLVTLPGIRSSVIASCLFSFVFSLSNIEVSLMLLPMGETTLPIQIANYMTWNSDPTVAALSTVQIIVTAFVLFVANRFVKLVDIVR